MRLRIHQRDPLRKERDSDECISKIAVTASDKQGWCPTTNTVASVACVHPAALKSDEAVLCGDISSQIV